MYVSSSLTPEERLHRRVQELLKIHLRNDYPTDKPATPKQREVLLQQLLKSEVEKENRRNAPMTYRPFAILGG